MTDMHMQCAMERNDVKYTAWVPAKFAVVGKYLRLKMENGKWEDGWLVKEATTPRPSTNVIARSWDYMETRKASDI